MTFCGSWNIFLCLRLLLATLHFMFLYLYSYIFLIKSASIHLSFFLSAYVSLSCACSLILVTSWSFISYTLLVLLTLFLGYWKSKWFVYSKRKLSDNENDWNVICYLFIYFMDVLNLFWKYIDNSNILFKNRIYT